MDRSCVVFRLIGHIRNVVSSSVLGWVAVCVQPTMDWSMIVVSPILKEKITLHNCRNEKNGSIWTSRPYVKHDILVVG